MEQIDNETDFEIRSFLNDIEHCGGAFIKARVLKKVKRYNIQINDCVTSIKIHGFYANEQDYKNTIQKINSIKEVIEKVEIAIKESYATEKKVKQKKVSKKITGTDIKSNL